MGCRSILGIAYTVVIFVSQLEMLAAMMVSAVKSFAHGNVIIAKVLPWSPSTLINNKLQGFVGKMVEQNRIEAEDNKENRMMQKNKTVVF